MLASVCTMLAAIHAVIHAVLAAVCTVIAAIHAMLAAVSAVIAAIHAVLATVCAVLAAVAPVLLPGLAGGGPLIVIQSAVPIRIEPLQDSIPPRLIRILSQDRPGGEQ